jgi:hypothetical protein
MSNTGGPAFPLHTAEWHEEVNQKGYVQHDFTMGMTLRDYFAAKAMQAELFGGVHQHDFGTTAKRAYEMADAMLRAREVK